MFRVTGRRFRPFGQTAQMGRDYTTMKRLEREAAERAAAILDAAREMSMYHDRDDYTNNPADEVVPVVTEREAVLRERRAFQNGVRKMWQNTADTPGKVAELVADEAPVRYPLPKVTRPRVLYVEAEAKFVRWANGRVEVRPDTTGDWDAIPSRLTLYHPDFIRAVADLKTNPTEEVEA